MPRGRPRIDLTGERFDRLRALRPGPRVSGGCTTWVCLCDCGTETVVRTTNLLHAATGSCGCNRGTRHD
jgi:hypothetical protein